MFVLLVAGGSNYILYILFPCIYCYTINECFIFGLIDKALSHGGQFCKCLVLRMFQVQCMANKKHKKKCFSIPS